MAMNRLGNLLAAVTVCSAVALSSRDASALGIEAGGLAGYGLQPFSDGVSGNRYGVALGARAGAEFTGKYIGAAFLYYLGSDLSGLVQTHVSGLQYGLELGYQASFGPVTLRPYLFGGPHTYSAGTSASSDTRLVLAPAALLRFSAMGPLFFGADARYAFILGGNGEEMRQQLSILGTIGASFGL